MSGWGALLNDVYIDGGLSWSDLSQSGACSGLAGVEPIGCLLIPPDGLGLPELRTGDVAYPQRDGVRHFDDYYGARILTLEVAVGPNDVCQGCSPRESVQKLLQAWSRQCDDTELVLFTDCHGLDNSPSGRMINGPYGVVGRPRQAILTWTRSSLRTARLVLRFDAVDQRLFVLDSCGTPGSGEQCVTLTSDTEGLCRNYPRCYPMCYDVDTGNGEGPTTFDVQGSLCVHPSITLNGDLTDPIIENLTTGEKIGYSGSILASAEPVIIDTQAGTATQGGSTRTHLITGSPRFSMGPGSVTLRLTSFGATDDGNAQVCWRPAVESA